MLKFGPRGFERSKRSLILAFGGIELAFVFIKPGQRTLRLPLQEDWAIRRLRDFAECILRSGSVMQPGGYSPLNQLRIDLVPPIVILSRLGKRLIRITLRVVQLSDLLGDEG